MPAADFSRWPKPEDIARVILFLASEDAKEGPLAFSQKRKPRFKRR